MVLPQQTRASLLDQAREEMDNLHNLSPTFILHTLEGALSFHEVAQTLIFI